MDTSAARIARRRQMPLPSSNCSRKRSVELFTLPPCTGRHYRTMKRRATNIRVTKRAAAVPAGSNGTFNGQDANNPNTTGGGVGNKGVHGNNNEQKEYMGVVSLVNTERHFGFIDGIGQDERVFFHLSEVLMQPESDDQDTAKAEDAVTTAEGNPRVANSPVVPIDQSSGKNNSGPIIERGQEVSFRLGQRQGKPLGLCVKKLKGGTLPSEETLPTRFVGVVVVAPRTTAGAGGGGGASTEKVTVTKYTLFELVLLNFVTGDRLSTQLWLYFPVRH